MTAWTPLAEPDVSAQAFDVVDWKLDFNPQRLEQQ
jgi:hypothetical protein